MRFTSKFVRFENWEDSRRLVRTTVQSRMNSEDGGESGPRPGEVNLGSDPFAGPTPDIMPGPGEGIAPF